MNYSVGQKAYIKYFHSKEDPFPVVVQKVGRKWIEFTRDPPGLRIYKVEIATGLVQDARGSNWSPTGRVWASLEEYRAAVAADNAWHAFQRAVQYGRIKVSAQDIFQCASILGLTLEGIEP